jgi:hypothetical protein
MTTDKGFKQLVRARMAKTGERYAAARRALLGGVGSPLAGGTTEHRTDPEIAALTRVLADRGVTSPITGRPLSEAMILGIGGGLGAGYILWEFKAREGALLTLGFRNRWQYPAIPGWYGQTLERLGIDADLHETNGAAGARSNLDAILAEDRSVIAWIDHQTIGTWHVPDALSGYWGYPVVVVGRTGDGAYLVDDRGRDSFVVDDATMAAARARIGSYKHRLIDPRPAIGEIAESRLRSAIEAGLADQVEHLRSSSDSFSLPAWRKWSRMMTDSKNAKGWSRVFAGGQGLFAALLSIVEAVDGRAGASGGHLRERYADFLDEIAEAGLGAFDEAADRWRVAADLWEDLADAALPPDLDGGLEAAHLAERLHAAVRQGEPGRTEAATVAERLWAIRAEHADGVSLADDRMADVLADLGSRLAHIHAAEVAAIDALAAAIGRSVDPSPRR